MRKAFLAALFAALGTSAVAMDLSPSVSGNDPRLGHWSGRWSLCRAYFEKQGYPHAYLHRSRRANGANGLLSACSRELREKYRRTA